MSEDGATLGELVTHLRRELDAAQRDDPANPARFGVDSIELEMTVSVSRGQKGTSGLRLQVLSTGAEHSTADAATMRVKLQLTPTERRAPTGELRVSALDIQPDTAGREMAVSGGTKSGA